ncbi:hypothetical protein [Streptomyces sp. NPDC092307]|uniref:hypothetical protein n=1 Tax=Streptomyces sp. NPDC092307 TaxID=3366013 RepID=UPI003813B610
MVRDRYRNIWNEFEDGGCGEWGCCGKPYDAWEFLDAVTYGASSQVPDREHAVEKDEHTDRPPVVVSGLFGVRVPPAPERSGGLPRRPPG